LIHPQAVRLSTDPRRAWSEDRCPVDRWIVHDILPALLAAMRVARDQDGMVTYRQAKAAGLTDRKLRRLVRKGWWRSPVRGAFIVQDVPGLRARVRAALVARPSAVACDLTAARLLGFAALPQATPDEPVHLLLPRRMTRAQARGVVLHWGDLPRDQVVQVRGIPATSPARTLADLVLRGSREEAVAMMDAALRSEQVPDLDLVRAAAGRRPGARRAGTWWALADRRAESALETRLRLLLTDAELTPEELQWPIIDPVGRIAARLDLAWPSHRLDVEADGTTVHDQPAAVYRDRHRQNLLTGRGWTVLRFTWSDVLRRPKMIISSVAGALAVAGTAPAADEAGEGSGTDTGCSVERVNADRMERP
jgi:very-short-patch-repair endonuclease